MSRLHTHIDTGSEAYRRNHAEMTARVEALRALTHRVRHERPQRDLDRLHRQKKLTVRERLDLLLDPGSPFLELSTLAANRAYEGEVHGAGQVSGIGIVNGREVVIHADDPSIKGGAWYPLSIKKIVRTLDIEARLQMAGGSVEGRVLGPDGAPLGNIWSNHHAKARLNEIELGEDLWALQCAADAHPALYAQIDPYTLRTLAHERMGQPVVEESDAGQVWIFGTGATRLASLDAPGGATLVWWRRADEAARVPEHRMHGERGAPARRLGRPRSARNGFNVARTGHEAPGLRS